MQWDPVQYVRYADERARPFHDLLARVGAAQPRRVVDVGCGPGTLTAGLLDRWPAAQVEGIDSSPEMIDAAARLGAGRLSFRLGDATAWTPTDDTDVTVSNATLQWVPDHLEVLRRWADAVPDDGWLAVQVPGNFESPSHTLMRDVASAPRWRDRLDGVLRHAGAVASPAEYADALLEAGLVADVWETTYVHVLTGPDPVLQWVRGTGLRPVLDALGPGSDDATAFEADYGDRLREAYPRTAHGTLFPFRRVFAVGHRLGGGGR